MKGKERGEERLVGRCLVSSRLMSFLVSFPFSDSPVYGVAFHPLNGNLAICTADQVRSSPSSELHPSLLPLPPRPSPLTSFSSSAS